MSGSAPPDCYPSGARLPATWNYGAIEKALRDASTRGERCIFEPKGGQVFQTIEEAYEFFNMYSWEVGFGIRYGRSRINSSKMKSRQDIVCSCEGRDKAASSRSSRCDCPCMLSLLRAEDESWYVKRFVGEHSHKFSNELPNINKFRHTGNQPMGSHDAGSVVDQSTEGFALRVLGVPSGDTRRNIADAFFSGIYPCRTLYQLETGTRGELYAVLEYDWVMKILDRRRVTIEYQGELHRQGFARVPRTEIRGRTGPCMFRRMN